MCQWWALLRAKLENNTSRLSRVGPMGSQPCIETPPHRQFASNCGPLLFAFCWNLHSPVEPSPWFLYSVFRVVSETCQNYSQLCQIYSEFGVRTWLFHKFSQEYIWRTVEQRRGKFLHPAGRTHQCAHVRWITSQFYASVLLMNQLSGSSEQLWHNSEYRWQSSEVMWWKGFAV